MIRGGSARLSCLESIVAERKFIPAYAGGECGGDWRCGGAVHLPLGDREAIPGGVSDVRPGGRVV